MSSVHNVFEFGQAWWAEVRKKVKNAVVFLDPVACECLHWNGGAPSILEAGASCIRELSTFEIVPKNVKKGVFISSAAWHGTNYKILENLIKNSNLEYCVIITAVHVSVHHLLHWGGGRESHNEVEVFDKIEEDVLNWMGNLNYTVEIFSYPLSTLHPTRETVLIPSAKSTEPFLPSDLGYLNEQLHLFSKQVEAPTLRSINDLTFGNLPLESQAQIRQLAHNLNQLLQHMNGKDEIFTVGSFSRIVGTELEALNSAKTRRKTATNKVSVILVDRILDLASVTNCSSENLFDRLLLTLNRLHDFSSDVAIGMTGKTGEDITVAPGCLAPQMNFNDGWNTMGRLFHEGSREAIDSFMNDIRDALEISNDDHSVDLVSQCNKNWDFIEKYTHLYQIGNAIWQNKKNFKASRIDDLEGIRKTLVESIDSDSPSPLIQIIQLMKTRKESNLSLDDILLLLVHLYSLAGDQQENIFPVEIEDRFKSLLAEILVQDCDNLSDVFQEFVGVPVDEIKAHRAAQKIVEQLHFISSARCHMKRYHTLYQRRNVAMPLECTSFLQQLINDIFDPSVVDNPDLEHKSGSLKDLLKSGFSLFVNVRKPKPTDNPIILLYVCGGIRPDEVKIIRDLFRQKSPSHKVIIASSHFISAHDALHYVFKKNIPL